jgi:hypothetical protein
MDEHPWPDLVSREWITSELSCGLIERVYPRGINAAGTVVAGGH